MSRRLDDDERSVADIFGVDVDAGKFGRAKARARRIEEEEGSAVAMSEKDWERYERDYDKNRTAAASRERKNRVERAMGLGDGRGGISPKAGKVIAVAGTIAGGLGLVWLASKLFGGSAEAAPSPTASNPAAAPPPPPPSKATAHAGASLAVRTPQKTGANLRTAAGVGSPKATPPLLAESAVVTVLDSATADKARWYKVKTASGVEGWVHGDLLVAAPGGSAS